MEKQITPLAKVEKYEFAENNLPDQAIIDWLAENYDCSKTVYLEEAKDKFVDYLLKTFGIQLTADQKRAAGTRIYFALHYLRDISRQQQAEKLGLQKFTLAMEKCLLPANIGKKIMFNHEGMFGQSEVILKIKKIGDKIYLMRPKARRSYIPAINFINEYFKIMA